MRTGLLTTKDPARQSRNRNSEYLPQRRKGRKVRRLGVKIIYKSFCPFPINLGAFAAWREKFPTRIFARAAQILNYSNTKSTKVNSKNIQILRVLRVLRGENE